MGDAFELVVCIAGPILIIITAIVLISTPCEYYSCKNYEELSGKNTEWKFFGGCYIQTSDGYLKMSQYDKTFIAKDALRVKE